MHDTHDLSDDVGYTTSIWLAKSTENITAECEASPSSTKTLCADEHPQLSQMPHRGKKGHKKFSTSFFHFDYSIPDYRQQRIEISSRIY